MINAQKMLDAIRINEEAKDFDLLSWFSECGTYGCFWGNYLVSQGKINNTSYDDISKEFNITYAEAQWLFSAVKPLKDHRNSIKCDTYFNDNSILILSVAYNKNKRENKDRKAVLDRVRKFIYYKLHKQELMESRDLEGDHHAVNKAVEKVNIPHRKVDNFGLLVSQSRSTRRPLNNRLPYEYIIASFTCNLFDI